MFTIDNPWNNPAKPYGGTFKLSLTDLVAKMMTPAREATPEIPATGNTPAIPAKPATPATPGLFSTNKW
jgi:hypothetical protein